MCGRRFIIAKGWALPMRNAREHKLFMLVWQFLPPRDLRFQRWFGLDVPLHVKKWVCAIPDAPHMQLGQTLFSLRTQRRDLSSV